MRATSLFTASCHPSDYVFFFLAEDLKLDLYGRTGLVVIPLHRLSYLKAAVHPPPSPRMRLAEYASLIHSPLGRSALAAMSGLKSTPSISMTPFARSCVRA